MRISDWSSDVCFPIFKNRRPGPQLIDIDDPAQFEPAVRRALSRPPELMAAVKAFADQLHLHRDGRSSERVLEAIDAFIAQGGRNRRRKPMILWRKLKLSRRIGYWGQARPDERRVGKAGVRTSIHRWATYP